MDHTSWGGSQVYVQKLGNTSSTQTITSFHPKKPTLSRQSMKPHGSEMYEIPCWALLQLLPSMFTPELAQTLTACPVGLSLLQLLPAASLQTGAWLSYTTPGEMPLSCSISLCVPSGWRKMYSLLGYCCHRHLNSNHSSFLLYPQRMEWPHNWKHACGQISGGETKFIITACKDQEVDSDCFTLKLRYKMNMGYFHAKMSNWKEAPILWASSWLYNKAAQWLSDKVFQRFAAGG